MRRRPVVAVVARPGSTRPLRAVVAALATRVEVRAASRAADPAAVLVADPSPGAAMPPAVPPGLPVARLQGRSLRVDGAAPIDLPTGPTVSTAAAPPLPPLVRRRWRERLGLPVDLVVDVAALPEADRPTALAVATAALVGEADLPLALALGCPTATSAGAATAIGVVDGDQVVVGDLASARALAADEARAARLSRLARAHAVAHLDAERVAERLLDAWGLARRPGPIATLDARLAELGTAPAAPIRRRAADALALFGGP